MNIAEYPAIIVLPDIRQLGGKIMISDIFAEEVKKEGEIFLSLCSLEDKQKLTGQISMTYQDYLRIICIIHNIDLMHYKIKINEEFPEFYIMMEEMLERHRDIVKEYPDYYEDEGWYKRERKWLIDFCSQISDEQQQEKYVQLLMVY